MRDSISRLLTGASTYISAVIVNLIPGVGAGETTGSRSTATLHRPLLAVAALQLGCRVRMPTSFGQIQRWVLIGLNLQSNPAFPSLNQPAIAQASVLGCHVTQVDPTRWKESPLAHQ